MRNFKPSATNVKDLLERTAKRVEATEKQDRESQSVVDLWFWKTIEVSYADPETSGE